MATYEILYWQEIPSQIRVTDGNDEVKIQLPQRFQELIDRTAAQRGLLDSDAYLDQWNWSEPRERPGNAREVADALQAELEEKFRK